MWSRNIKFEGWYFKHQLGDTVVAFIPGKAESGSFIQVISSWGSRRFTVPKLIVKGNIIQAGKCLFTPYGCQIRLPGIRGDIYYGDLTPLTSDIMGPFRFFPMECRHGVVSMAHTLEGGLTIDGIYHSFDGGIGYIEKDSGISFPCAYQWLQCNTFSEPCSVMASIAHIPFFHRAFTGCICDIVYEGKEYRLATYRGVRILTATERHIRLAQHHLLLDIRMRPVSDGHPLLAPSKGQMKISIRESICCRVRIRLWDRGKLILNLCSNTAAYEYVKK